MLIEVTGMVQVKQGHWEEVVWGFKCVFKPRARDPRFPIDPLQGPCRGACLGDRQAAGPPHSEAPLL